MVVRYGKSVHAKVLFPRPTKYCSFFWDRRNVGRLRNKLDITKARDRNSCLETSETFDSASVLAGRLDAIKFGIGIKVMTRPVITDNGSSGLTFPIDFPSCEDRRAW